MRGIAVLLTGLSLLLAGCSAVAERAENAANRSFTSYALGKPYAEVANLNRSPLMQLSTTEATFGPMIGETRLKNGMVVYRHIAPAARTETGTDFGGLVGSSSVNQNNRLSYFLVGPDGIVRDWATGSVQGNVSSCIYYIGGIINRCTDAMQLQQSLALYDARVTTRDNRPISAWGEPAPAAPSTSPAMR